MKDSTSLIASLSRRLLIGSMAFLLLSGCLSMSASSGGKSGASSEVSGKSGTGSTLDNDNEISIKGGSIEVPLKEGFPDPNGKWKVNMPDVLVKTGSKSGQKSETEQSASASSFNEFKQEMKQDMDLVSWIFWGILLALLGCVVWFLWHGRKLRKIGTVGL